MGAVGEGGGRMRTYAVLGLAAGVTRERWRRRRLPRRRRRCDAAGGRGRRRPGVRMCGGFLTCVGRDWVGSKSNPHFAEYGFWAGRRNRPCAGQIPRVGGCWAFSTPKLAYPNEVGGG
jgi:hypothetical protein